MPDLTEEEKKILRQAYEIKERIKAEELEAGEVSVDEAVDEDLSTDKPIQRRYFVYRLSITLTPPQRRSGWARR